MNFREWFYLYEDYKLHKSYKKIADTKKLGRFGRFITSYAVKKGHEDRSQEAYELMKEKAPLANQKLTMLGFPEHKRNTIVSDGIGLFLDKIPDFWYGTAHNQEHGMDVSFDALKSSEGTNVLIHEYAHMYYFNMPKIAKDYFADQYEKWFNDFSEKDINEDDVDKEHLKNVVFDKIKELNLINLILSFFQNFCNEHNKAEECVDFILSPENKNLVETQLQKHLESWIIYNDLWVQDGSTMSGSYPIIPFDFDLKDAIKAENILNQIRKEYESHKAINQHEPYAIYLYVTPSHFEKFVDKSMIKIGKLNYFDKSFKNELPNKKHNQFVWDAFTKKYNLPEFGASLNKDELWAVTVTSAANNIRSVSPLLKNLIVQTLFMSR